MLEQYRQPLPWGKHLLDVNRVAYVSQKDGMIVARLQSYDATDQYYHPNV
jgi:hypothetical protein